MRTWNRTAQVLVFLAAGGLLVSSVACRQDRPKRKYVGPVDGIAREYDSTTGRVSMELFDPKTQLTMEHEGHVTNETEVEINGVAAALSDIKTNEPITVWGYQERIGGEKRFVVTKIRVRRGDVVEILVPDEAPPAVSEPAEQPGP